MILFITLQSYHIVVKTLRSENQQLMGGVAGSSAPMASEMSSLEDSSCNKVRRLSVEQRKEKIHRYMKKRNERNFSKKIKVLSFLPSQSFKLNTE